MAMPHIRTFVLVAIVSFAPAIATAQVPTKEDIASCNQKAKQDIETASASPRTDADSSVIATAGKRDAAGDTIGGGPSAAPKQEPANTGKPLSRAEADPHLQGIDPEGEKDPAYIAAYKTCMRQSGF